MIKNTLVIEQSQNLPGPKEIDKAALSELCNGLIIPTTDYFSFLKNSKLVHVLSSCTFGTILGKLDEKTNKYVLKVTINNQHIVSSNSECLSLNPKDIIADIAQQSIKYLRFLNNNKIIHQLVQVETSTNVFIITASIDTTKQQSSIEIS